jgi:hypothetical protein
VVTPKGLPPLQTRLFNFLILYHTNQTNLMAENKNPEENEAREEAQEQIEQAASEITEAAGEVVADAQETVEGHDRGKSSRSSTRR